MTPSLKFRLLLALLLPLVLVGIPGLFAHPHDIRLFYLAGAVIIAVMAESKSIAAMGLLAVCFMFWK